MFKTLGMALLFGVVFAHPSVALHDADVSDAEFKCQAAQNKAAAKFVATQLKCMSKCIAGARSMPPRNPESDCFPPFGGATLRCIADPLKGAEAKAIAAIDRACREPRTGVDCPECYSARSGAADCSGWSSGVIIYGLSSSPMASIEARVDAMGFLYCNDNPNSAAENKCQQGFVKALVKYAGCTDKCLDKCNGSMHKGTLFPDSCTLPSPLDPTTFACLFDPIRGCEARAIAACDKACFIPPADAPECYDGFSSAAIVQVADWALSGHTVQPYCGSPSGAFLPAEPR